MAILPLFKLRFTKEYLNISISIFLVYSCSSNQNRQKIIAYENPLTDVCPNYGSIDTQSEQFKKATHFPYELNTDPAFQQVAIKYGSDNINSVYVSNASNAKSIKSLKLWNNFKTEYKLFCSNVSKLPEWYLETESKFVKELLVECSHREYSSAEKCFANKIEETEVNSLPIFIEILKEEKNKPISNWNIVKFLKKSYPSDNDLLFKLHFFDAKERIKIEEQNQGQKIQNILNILKSAEELDTVKFKNSINYSVYTNLIQKHEDLKRLNSKIPEMEEEIVKKKKDSGICSYYLNGEFQKMIGNIHILYGATMWNDSNLCESQKIAFKNNFAGIVNGNFFGITNPDKSDYGSPILINIEKAFLSDQVTLTNGIKIFVFTKTPPPGYSSQEAAIKKLTDNKKSATDNIQVAWPALAKELNKLNLKIPE
jgi:hypothetical protein